MRKNVMQFTSVHIYNFSVSGFYIHIFRYLKIYAFVFLLSVVSIFYVVVMENYITKENKIQESKAYSAAYRQRSLLRHGLKNP